MPITERDTLIADAVADLTTRPDDADLLDLLHDLTAYVVALVGVRASGITVLDQIGGVEYLTASDEEFRQLEEEQIEFDEGPCVDGTRGGAPLGPVALDRAGAAMHWWPHFTPRALDAGITSVAAVPLRGFGDTIGALNLMTAGTPLLTPLDLRFTQALANAATSAVQHQRVLRDKDEVITQLQHALNSRVVIEQAKGMLSAMHGISLDEAFTRLRHSARHRRTKLSVLASAVTQGRLPDELAVQ
ncbi:transcription antitermination regulator [Mangrovactinospora gilvigrisea]|uniref:Transcription antitermination regulator n=1 Tax=Mangrovactinospora gilvigrisea TaxID=1428644 RepID=A0A1J7C1R1_9ACTN|nr:GAF and ANTAR domain-containing protein [Mangrovactinospora gilvigrisea]OIV35504.1 transcription antitermination regulator [Mangrovactinospora gilvigrisea]